jgi:acetyl esterase/lipase
MGGLALSLSLLLTLPAALLGALIVAPAPLTKVALLAVVVGEKGFLLGAAGILGAVLAVAAMRRGHAVGGFVSLVAGLAAVALGALPIVQGVQLASARKVLLDYGRYLTAPIDNAPAQPSKTVVYASPGGRDLALDVYPSQRAAAHPGAAVIVVHGGGWSSGDKGEAPLASAWLARQGYTVFDVQYRTAPQPNWQTATGDVKCAIGWVKAHAADFKIDPARVNLLGRSAGGHLALLAAMSPGDPSLLPSCSAGDTSVAAVAALYPATELSRGYEHPGNLWVYDLPQKIRDFLGGRPDTVPSAFRAASIVSRVGDGGGAKPPLPRVLLAHGARDQFIPAEQTHLLASRMRETGPAPDVLIVPYGQHGFDYVSGGLSGQILERALLQLFSGVP